MYLFFDTETNGLPVSWNAKMSDLRNWPRVIQLAWQMYDKDENLVMESCDLIVPDGWKIPTVETFINAGYNKTDSAAKAKFWSDNGFSTELNELKGIPIRKALDRFVEHYKKCQFMVAHNIDFDYNVVGSEMIRYGITTGGVKLARICTMRSSTSFCRITTKGKAGYKYPKLEELYKFLFKETFDGAHDALADVKATARSFFELKKRGIIAIP